MLQVCGTWRHTEVDYCCRWDKPLQIPGQPWIWGLHILQWQRVEPTKPFGPGVSYSGIWSWCLQQWNPVHHDSSFMVGVKKCFCLNKLCILCNICLVTSSPSQLFHSFTFNDLDLSDSGNICQYIWLHTLIYHFDTFYLYIKPSDNKEQDKVLRDSVNLHHILSSRQDRDSVGYGYKEVSLDDGEMASHVRPI